jgi:anti-anti-sigma factor
MKTLIYYYEFDGIGVIEILIDKLNIFNSSDFVDNIKANIEEKDKSRFILDLRNVYSMDSIGVGLLIAIKNKIAVKGRDIYLVCENDDIYRILQIANLGYYFKMFRTLHDAAQWINENRVDE